MPRETHRPVALLSLATAVPPHILQQEEAKALARTLFGLRMRLFEQLEPVFDNAGIARRHIVRPVEWYHGDHGWKARNHVYLEAAEALYVEAARGALDRAGIEVEHSSTVTNRIVLFSLAAARRAAVARPLTPPAQPRPNSGTRSASARKPIFPATRASRLGVAMPVVETVTRQSTSPASIPARSSAPRAASTYSASAASR